MEIVAMTQYHVPQIAAMERTCFSDPWSENSIASELDNRLSYWLVAEENGLVLGYIGSQSVLGETDIMNLAVSPEHRRKGIAKALLLALMDALKSQGNRCITLEVRQSNLPAQALYEQFGFRQVGLRPNYYRDPKEAALILRKEYET